MKHNLVLENLEQISKKFSHKYLNALIDFGQNQDQKSSLDISYFCAVLEQ